VEPRWGHASLAPLAPSLRPATVPIYLPWNLQTCPLDTLFKFILKSPLSLYLGGVGRPPPHPPQLTPLLYAPPCFTCLHFLWCLPVSVYKSIATQQYYKPGPHRATSRHDELLPTYVLGATENAGVDKSGADRRGGKCRSRLAVWKAEPILYSDTALIKLLS